MRMKNLMICNTIVFLLCFFMGCICCFASDSKEDPAFDEMNIEEMINEIKNYNMDDMRMSFQNLEEITFPTETVEKEKIPLKEHLVKNFKKAASWIMLQLWNIKFYLTIIIGLIGYLQYLKIKKERRFENGESFWKSKKT